MATTTTTTPLSTETTTTEPPKTTEAAPPIDPNKSLLNEEETPPAAKAPDTYTDFKVPDGLTLDKAVIEAATPLFKELNLNQDQAQKLVDFYTAQSKEVSEAPHKAYLEMTKKWQDEVKTEFGSKLPEVKANIGRALNSLGLAPDQLTAFRQAMDLTSAGNNPAFVRVFAKMAEKLAEGRPVTGGPAPVTNPNAAPKTPAQAMYPDLPSSAAGG